MGTGRLIFAMILFLSSCASKQQVTPFVEGCMYGTIMTYNQLMGHPLPQEYVFAAYEWCQKAEHGKDNQR